MLFSLAAALSAAWFGVHIFLGGREVAGPLRASTLDPLVRDVSYLCWHLTSWSIAAMALFFGLAALTGEAAYAVSGTLLAAGFVVVGIAIPRITRQTFAKMPQGWMFVPNAALGLAGLVL